MRRKNNLLVSTGLLELANAADIAANVFNTVPPPNYAVALMAVGGLIALSLSYCAIRDARLSYSNIKQLDKERRMLKAQTDPKSEHHDCFAKSVSTRMTLNTRELGIEWMDRLGMDILLGLGAVVVGLGTLLAIGGSNPIVFETSNYMTGYVGNGFSALYGLLNTMWRLYVWLYTHHSETACHLHRTF